MYNPNLLMMETHILKINWLREQIDNLPHGTIIKRKRNNGMKKYAVLIKNGKRIEKNMNLPEGKAIGNQIIMRLKYEQELEELESIWKKKYRIDIPIVVPCKEIIYSRIENDKFKPELVLDREAFDRIIPQTNTINKERWIEYKGVLYRSIQERMVAEVLDELNWEYKYEVTFDNNGIILSCDFAVYIRELNRVKFIEFFGSLGKNDYNYKIKKKMLNYETMGLIEDKDIIYIYADNKSAINKKLIASKLNTLVINYV